MDIYALKRGRCVRRSCCCAATVIYRSHQFAEKKVYTERLYTVYGNNVNKGRTDSCSAVEWRMVYIVRAFRYVYIILYRQNKHAAAVCKNFVVLLPEDLLYIYNKQYPIVDIIMTAWPSLTLPRHHSTSSRISLPRGWPVLFTVYVFSFKFSFGISFVAQVGCTGDIF